MAFSAALGIANLGLSAFGMFQSGQQAADALSMQAAQMQQQREMADQQLLLGIQAQRDQRAYNDYLMQQDQLNRILASNERAWEQSQYTQDRQTLSDERRQLIDRQLEMDRAAAQDRAFQLEQLLQNQEITEQERQFAIAQLEQAQAIAQGERDEDRRRLLEEQQLKQQEREFALSQYQSAQAQAMAERETDLALREQIMGEAGSLQETLQQVARDLGYIPEIPQLSENDIAAEIRRRESDYISDVDRAADRVASVNEADLIRAGMDDSTQATARRGDITRRIADEYQSARNRAYDDALAFITGKQSTMAQNVQDIMARRAGILDETAGINSANLETMLKLPEVGSALDAYQLMQLVPTGIQTRDLVSANTYSVPVNIGSGVYDNLSLGSSMGNTLNLPSAANNNWANIGSAIRGPASQTLTGPSSFMQNASTLLNGASTSASNYASSMNTLAGQAGQAFGQNLMNFGQEYGGMIDNWLGNNLGFGSGAWNQNATTWGTVPGSQQSAMLADQLKW